MSAAYFFNPRREVLNEQLAQVVEGLEFAGLEDRQIIEVSRKRQDCDCLSEDNETKRWKNIFHLRQSPPDPSGPVWSAHDVHARI